MRTPFFRNEEGQGLLWMAIGLPLLILFTAMAVDMAVIYQHKARLSNAVDAAVLTGAKNYRQGVPTAQTLATDMFQANFGTQPATLAWTWCPAAGAQCPTTAIAVTLHATAAVNTTFMAYLPQWAQWTIGDTAQATKSNLIMSLIIDRSGSMGSGPGCGGGSGDCGGVALQTAVPNFVQNFAEGVDYLSMISFSDDARVDVAMTQTFTSPIDSAVAGLAWDGGTFGTGAGTNTYDYVHGPPLSLADHQNNSVSFPAGQPYVKVVVYFTDGLMNEVQDTLACQNIGNTLYNYGGYDTGTSFDFMDPTKDTWETGDLSYYYAGTNGTAGSGKGCSTGGNGFCNGNPPYNATNSCKGVTQFYSQQYQTNEAFSRANITAESQWRAIYTAKQMGEETPVQTYIYVIGLGSGVNNASTEQFLATVANDNQGLYSNPYDTTRPPGLFLPVVNCPSASCTQDLNTAFETIAEMILLRLSQ